MSVYAVPPRLHVSPVIRTDDLVHVVRELDVATSQDIDGVFLIDHDREYQRLVSAIELVRDHYPRLFLGANFVGASPVDALAFATHPRVRLDALWTDNAAIKPDGDLRSAVEFLQVREKLDWHGVHFGGIAFKYQPNVPDHALELLGRLASSVVDVPTTSGSGTGEAAPIEKLRRLRRGLGAAPLALASGVTSDNIAYFLPYVSHVLVSTAICDDEGRIDPALLRHLIKAARRTALE